MQNKPDFAAVQWFKSSRSQTQNACVETAMVSGFTGVQDTKDPERKDRLVFGSGAWRSFIADVKAGQADV